MKTVLIGNRKVPAVIQGCMRLKSLRVPELRTLIQRLYDAGVSYWDHASTYGGGVCEMNFGEALQGMPGMRDKLILQSKCGIRPGAVTQYDSSKAYLLECVETSLRRLRTDHLDYLLLHRPDLLVEPEEVAAAFDQLEAQGKVLHFGVSNHSPGQIALLKTCVRQPIEINQLQFSLAHTLLLDSAYLNTAAPHGGAEHAGVLDECRKNRITIQCYSPFQYGFLGGTFLGNPQYAALNERLTCLAQKYGTTENGIAAAWILRHPAQMQVVMGTTNAERACSIARSSEIVLTREEWYSLYAAAGNRLP